MIALRLDQVRGWGGVLGGVWWGRQGEGGALGREKPFTAMEELKLMLLYQLVR